MSAPKTDGPDDDPPIPKWRYYTAACVALLLVGVGPCLPRSQSDNCAQDVKKVGEEGGARCVGLTDGGFAFTADLREVSRLIERENREVTAEADAGGTPYVSIVYLLGMRPQRQDSDTVESVRHELEGAYTAQYEANHRRGQGRTPRIRLLLGDIGNEDAQRRYTLDRVEARRDTGRIVAVAGLGTSLTGTRSMVSRLTGSGIAAFGSVATADALEKVHGLVRVAPPNADEAAAAVRFLRTGVRAGSRVLVVQDANHEDLYSATLASEFLRRFPEGRLAAPEPMQYDSSRTRLATYFSNQMANLCLQEPGVVYFAGRGRDLPDFLAPLANRQCKSTELTVLSGDDASLASQAEGFGEVKQALRNGNIRLVYTGLAHPGAWRKAPEYFDTNALAPFRTGGTFTRAFLDDRLADGHAIMAYDAVLTAVRAIRKAVPLENSDQKIRREDVLQMLTLLYNANAVPGASGWISLRNNGSPRGKAIPVIEIGRNGDSTTLAVVSGGSETPYLPPSVRGG